MPRRQTTLPSVTSSLIAGDLIDPRGLARHARSFVEWLGVQNYSEHTIRARRTCLNYFISWCEERGVTRPVGVTRQLVERY